MGRTEVELRKAAEHLRYEIEMLGFTAKALCSREIFCQKTDCKLTRNAILESWGIHARVLIDFLFPDRIHSDDILSSHYIPADSDWTEKLAETRKRLRRDCKDINKWLAHLTEVRLVDEVHKKKWRVGHIASDIREALLGFTEKAPADHLGADFADFVKKHLPSAPKAEPYAATTASLSELPQWNSDDN